jgi:N-acetyl-gamma-glutamyl-phosphate reductase
MHVARIGIIGASGFSGIELTRILARHPGASLAFLTSDRWVGQPVGPRAAVALPGEGLAYVSVEQGLAAAGGVDAVFLATPAETSLELAPRLRALGVRVVDLAGAFRLQDLSLYPRYYRFEHTAPALVKAAVYGLTEWNRAQIRGAAFVSNPGCYATAVAMQVAPLLRAGLIDPLSVVVSAASGVSGAGRKATEEFSFMEIDSDFRAYRTLNHQHLPEIRQTLTGVAGVDVPLVFTPHLLPLKRGILSTAVTRLRPGITAAQVSQALADCYGGEALVRLVGSADAVRLAEVAHTPLTIVGASVDGTHAVVTSAIDNLLKGAASQAVQNLNLMLGHPETTGLLAGPG